MRCPFFNHSLVLMIDHDDDGSFGFVVNKRAGLEFDRMLDDLGMERTIDSEREVMMGGPVSPQTGWIVYDRSEAIDAGAGAETDESLVIGGALMFTSSLGLLQQMGHGHGPGRGMMLLGYSGWSPGQLEDELREGSWIPVDLDPELIFATPVADRWTAALATLGIHPGQVASLGVPSA